MTLSGQVETMRESYTGLFTGIALAIVLVYLFLVMNFQSWIDPLIVLMAVPFALGGVLWMLFLSQTPMSVPALMGTLMCIGLTTANSILVVSFANQRMDAGDDPLRAAATAGYTRLRPVLMTAGAMILGMVPMALGIGEGGEQNAPLARAVIGGLLFATFATLIFVPTMYRLLRRGPQQPPVRSPMTLPPPQPRATIRSTPRSAVTIRSTDFAADVSASEAHAVSTRFDPATGERLKRAAIIAAVVLAVAFVLVSVDRFLKARSVARATAAAANAPPVVEVVQRAAGGRGAGPGAAGTDRGLVQKHDLRARQRLSSASGSSTSAITCKRARCWRSSRHPNSMRSWRRHARS